MSEEKGYLFADIYDLHKQGYDPGRDRFMGRIEMDSRVYPPPSGSHHLFSLSEPLTTAGLNIEVWRWANPKSVHIVGGATKVCLRDYTAMTDFGEAKVVFTGAKQLGYLMRCVLQHWEPLYRLCPWPPKVQDVPAPKSIGPESKEITFMGGL